MYNFLSSKLYEIRPGSYMHYCPGCKHRHVINTIKSNCCGDKWIYNNNPEFPTFTPSICISVNHPDFVNHEIVGIGIKQTASNKFFFIHERKIICHYFITDGKLIYLNDSHHFLAGQTIDLPDII